MHISSYFLPIQYVHYHVVRVYTGTSVLILVLSGTGTTAAVLVACGVSDLNVESGPFTIKELEETLHSRRPNLTCIE